MRKSEPDSKYFGENLEYLCSPCQNRQKPPKNMRIIYCVVPKEMHNTWIVQFWGEANDLHCFYSSVMSFWS